MANNYNNEIKLDIKKKSTKNLLINSSYKFNPSDSSDTRVNVKWKLQ